MFQNALPLQDNSFMFFFLKTHQPLNYLIFDMPQTFILMLLYYTYTPVAHFSLKQSKPIADET